MSDRRTNGIRVRHARSCPATGGKCKCKPSYEAFVYSAREGKKIRQPFPTLAAAKAWRDDSNVGVRKGTLRTPTRATLRETAETLIEGMKAGTVRTRSGDTYKPSVVRAYESVLRHHVLDDLGGLRLGAVARRDVQELVDRLLYRRAITRDDVTVNPTTGLELPAVRGKRERVASPVEAAALVAAVHESDRALWATALYAGLRLGELRALRVRDLAGDVIQVERGWDSAAGPVAPKSAAGVRKVPVPATLAVHLDSHLQRAQRDADALLFGRTALDPFTDTNMRAKAQEAWTAAGLAKIGFHECRHSYSSMLSAAGVDQTRADWYLGHADHSTPGRYRHPLPGQLAKDAETLDAYLVGATSGKVVPLRTGAHTGAHVPQTRMVAAK